MTITTELSDSLYVWSFMEQFVEALRSQLEEDEKRWGDTWRRRVRFGHEERILNDFADYYDQFKNTGTPIPWLKVAGLAMIAWIRENQTGWTIEE